MPRTQVLLVDSVLGAALLAAAVDDGLLGAAERRLLLVANTAEPPEVVPPPQDAPGFAALARRFDEVLDWNAVLAPLHPAGWYPSAAERPLLSRLLRRDLGLDGPVELVLDGLARTPASAVAALLPDGPITVLSDSLLAWGPPARALTGEQAGRVTRLLHLPVLPGVRPLLLADAVAEAAAVPGARLAAVLAELPASRVPGPAVLLVGEQPGVSDTAPDELLRRAALHGAREAVLVPHPGSEPADDRGLLRLADELGVGLHVTDDRLPAEAVLARSRPALVVGGIGATLVLARDVFGLPVATVGADRVLARRKPGPQRVPATIVHATVPALGPDGRLTAPPAPDHLSQLVDAVAYSLAPDVLADRRAAAAAHLAAHGGGPYVSPERLVALGLAPAGDVPAPVRPRTGGPRGTLRRLGRAVLR